MKGQSSIEIDASHGEGGGQVVRTAVALAAVTGTPVELERIRADRDDPGLKRQHLACIEVLAATCDATVEGAELDSTALAFAPGDGIEGGRYEVDIGTAGSTTLLAQAVLPAGIHAEGRLELAARGGTDVAWSPPADYLQAVTLSLLERAGVDARFGVLRRGHYPKGGGRVALAVEPGELDRLDIGERGDLQRIRGVSEVANLNEGIAERQRRAAAEALAHADVEAPVEIAVAEDDEAHSKGSCITLWAEYGGTRIGGCALGERGKRAEDVGRDAAEALLDGLRGPGTVDRYASDQLVPFLALGGGEYVAPRATSHLETNAWVCRRFGCDVTIDEDAAEDGVVVSGTGTD